MSTDGVRRARRFASVTAAIAFVAVQVWVIGVRSAGVPSIRADSGVEAGPIGGPVTLTQTFAMGQMGLNGVALGLRPAAPATIDADVVLELAEVHDAGASSPTYRIVRRMADVATGQQVWWRFPSVADSAGKTYRIRIAVPNQLAERGVFVQSTRDERYRDGILAIDGRDVWGDAGFATSASHGTLFDRARLAQATWPSWVSWTCAGVWLALSFGATYAVAMRALTGVRPPPRGGGVASARLRTPGVVAVVLVAVACATWATQWVRRSRTGGREPGATQLLDRFPEATKRTSMSHLQDAFHREDVSLDERWACLMALPSSRVTWRQAITAPARLRVAYGLRPDTWHGPGDGAAFRVGIGARGAYRDVLTVWLNPAERETDRGLRTFDFDLSPYVGDDIDIVFNTAPGPSGNAVGDAALWCAPRLVPEPPR